jgi:hypothetical protein
MGERQKIHGRYFADGFLLEAAAALADTGREPSSGRFLYGSDRVVLFTALAAEAHINHAIETGLSGAAQEAAQRLRVREKLRLVPGLANASAVFDPGRGSLQGLYQLVGRRNRLVHGEPDVWEIEFTDSGQWASIQYAADSFGTPVADAARWLLNLCEYLDSLAAGGVPAWEDHAYLARELLLRRSALDAWDPEAHSADLRSMVEDLAVAQFDEEQ